MRVLAAEHAAIGQRRRLGTGHIGQVLRARERRGVGGGLQRAMGVVGIPDVDDGGRKAEQHDEADNDEDEHLPVHG